MSNTWRTVGSVRRGKDKEDGTKGSLYLKVDGDIKKGETVQLQDPRKKLAASVAAGRIDEAKATSLLSKLPEYILYDLVIAPAR
jgi:hypothetical protein